jgi:2-keto-4-pentenoate hydratase/2-oxohepta-3-ene-1,7-dioic acid hydratase in catechol pathway
MKFANLDGRAVLTDGHGAIDVAKASGGAFPSAPIAVFQRWHELRAWAGAAPEPDFELDITKLGPPMPEPRQVFAIGANYAEHALEGGVDVPSFPVVFTKYPSCLAGPHATVALPSGLVDWEVELVLVIGTRAHEVARGDGWSHVAGVTVGQDLSERAVQVRPPMPQFSLGKSFPGFGPIGPWIVTDDELAVRDDLAISCTLNGEEVQASRTSEMVFDVDALIHHLSSVTPLLPGDLIFTGTPPGVGFVRDPPRFLAAGDQLVSTIEGIGSIRTEFVVHGIAVDEQSTMDQYRAARDSWFQKQ